ncbi:hypothetical protein FG386_000887 [Cryptosporidium ryanae]|uniref:uncharacterized protein n=1 Tax=Cryptosporidium ryanae TaxID=515981 RepID=UPI003519FD09|nr:hypothetical protein FG386_000887 [Cryptosporidium ryanae]
MLKSNLSKPVQLNIKGIGISRGNAKKELILDEIKNLNTPIKRKPSVEFTNKNDIDFLKKEKNIESNLATRPEPISKAALEEARAKRATKSITKQVVVSQKTKIEKHSSGKKEAKHKVSTEKVKKKTSEVEKPLHKEDVSNESVKVKSDESMALMLEIESLKKQQKIYQDEIKELKQENLASMRTIRALENEKKEEYQSKKDIELKKKLLESGHQKNIDKIQNLIRNCRIDIKTQFDDFIKSDPKIKPESHKRKNNSSIISLLLCDKSYDKGLLDQLIMIEENNGNIWGLSSRDLKELNSILNFYSYVGMDAKEIKEHLGNLNWFLDMSSQQYSSIPYITNSIDKLYQNGVNFEEFLTFLFVPLFSSSHYSYLDQLFNLFDMDNDSYISVDDLKSVLREIEWEDAFTINDLKYLLRQMSASVNNEEYEGRKLLISRGEFNDFFRSIFD